MVKKEKKIKSCEQCAKEIETLMNQVLEFGFPLDHPSIQEFIKITKEFEKNPETGACSGVLKLSGFQRNLVYILSKQPHIISRITLEYNKNV